MYNNNFEGFKKELKNKSLLREDNLYNMKDFYVIDGKNAIVNNNLYEMTNSFHYGLSKKLQIPFNFYNRIKTEEPRLYEKTVNVLNKTDKTQLFRSHKIKKNFKFKNLIRGQSRGSLRALLSDRYKIIDNQEVINHLEPLFQNNKFVLLSAYQDENIMSMKIRFPSLIGSVRQGDTVFGGIYLRNSEVGRSSLTITGLIYRLVCTNGLMLPNTESIANTFHLGAKNEIGTNPNYIIPQVAIEKVDSVIEQLFNKHVFQDNINKLRETTLQTFKKVNYEKIKEIYQTTEQEEEFIKEELEKEKDYTLYGLIQAFTSTARRIKNIQRSLYFERIGGSLMNNSNKVIA
jgi:hypothetical protein